MTHSSNNSGYTGSRDPKKIAVILLAAVAVIMLLLLVRNCAVDDPHYNTYDSENTKASASPNPDSGQGDENIN